MIKQLLELVTLVLAVLALPVVLVCIYDQLVLGPKRTLTAEGVPAPGPWYVRVAYSLLPFVLLGVAWQIGIKPLMGWIMKLALPLSVLAIPVVLLCAYDHWVAAPRRPKTAEGYPTRAPLYVRIAYGLLPFVLIAVVLYIKVPVVFGWIKQVAVPLSWLAAPVAVWCALDSWLFAPRRAIAAGTTNIADPPALRAAYMILPVLVVAVIVRMISAETLDFSLVLLVLTVATGVVWAIDHFLFRKPREAAAAAARPAPLALPEPGTVDYARSFFPVAFIVLLVRAFIFEPFRIPSDSMMPTLLDGDFIVVNKYAYGLRWPVINEKFVDLGSPQRGDVVVFRYPPNPSVNYIKRLVGLPGDRVEVHDDQLIINGEVIPLTEKGRFTDGCYVDLRLSTETLGEHTHEVMSCRWPQETYSTKRFAFSGETPPLSSCDRENFTKVYGTLICRETPPGSGPDRGDYALGKVVPAGQYLMIGDNRDNSEDSRVWGFVPEQNLVGKATRIWFNFDMQRPSVVNLGRIGNGIE
jgi:signal peptidase I